jgi:glycerol-1-phosphate dehydrogenase [NAD(P)+]
MEYVAPNVVTGPHALGKVLGGVRAPLICAAAEPWAMLERRGMQARAVRIAESADLEAVEATEASLPNGDLVVGIGGGTAVDNAKYVAWKRHLPLVTMPTTISVDAFLTNQVAVRVEGVVRYVGDVWPGTVVIDHDLIRMAPKRLNAAGAADVLSIHTALFDWRVAAEDRGERYSGSRVQEAREILIRLELGAADIAVMNNRGIDLMVELYSAEVELCARNGNARPEEGSEHLFVYNLERTTGKQLIHGEMVGTGIWLMSRLQGNAPGQATELMDRLGIRYRPIAEDVTREEIRQTLLTLRSFVESEGLFYSVVNRLDPDPAQVNALVDGLLG